MERICAICGKPVKPNEAWTYSHGKYYHSYCYTHREEKQPSERIFYPSGLTNEKVNQIVNIINEEIKKLGCEFSNYEIIHSGIDLYKRIKIVIKYYFLRFKQIGKTIPSVDVNVIITPRISVEVFVSYNLITLKTRDLEKYQNLKTFEEQLKRNLEERLKRLPLLE